MSKGKKKKWKRYIRLDLITNQLSVERLLNWVSHRRAFIYLLHENKMFFRSYHRRLASPNRAVSYSLTRRSLLLLEMHPNLFVFRFRTNEIIAIVMPLQISCRKWQY